jgi:YD repeat-containing protein
MNDGVNQYVYGLDGRICAVRNVAAGSVMTQYVYDAEGRRVAKGTISTWPAAGQTRAGLASTSPISRLL